MPRTPDPLLRALWRERVRHQIQSGLTVAQFCAQERLPVKLFYAWRHRLGLREFADRRSTLATPATFLPVRVRVAEHTQRESPPIEADLPNGVRLRIPTSDMRLACRLTRIVVEASTKAGGPR
jgi:hypothetical protein